MLSQTQHSKAAYRWLAGQRQEYVPKCGPFHLVSTAVRPFRDTRENMRLISFIRAFNIGLTDGLSAELREHRRAVDGFLLLIDGYVARN